RRRHTRFSRDWSSDVCSSDLINYTVDTCNADFTWSRNTANPNTYYFNAIDTQYTDSITWYINNNAVGNNASMTNFFNPGTASSYLVCLDKQDTCSVCVNICNKERTNTDDIL